MKILHLADLHIGKKVNNFCMLKEQKYALEQACELIKNNDINIVLIAGDIFDRPVPSIGALELFESFLNELKKINVSIYMVSGNHDSMDRLAYLSNLLSETGVYISKSFDGNVEFYDVENNTRIYLLPYLYPALVKKYHLNENIKNYNDAISAVLNDIVLDKDKFNIIVAHQFVLGKDEMILSQSEQKSVGGIDEITYKVFEKFDYCALGHLHCPQKCGIEKIRYAGSILKYSFSEINQKKNFIVLNIDANKKLDIEFHPIKSLHKMREYKGYISEFLDKSFYKNIDTDDYIHFILLDESVIDAKKKLSLIYPNIMMLEFDNNFTKNLNNDISIKNMNEKSIYEHFCDFYKKQLDSSLDDEKSKIVQKVLNKKDSVCGQ
ncbi:exonuclease SbcCD subunit D [bacterium]|nr:exonuclease SbcCD subunit D [bacterium]